MGQIDRQTDGHTHTHAHAHTHTHAHTHATVKEYCIGDCRGTCESVNDGFMLRLKINKSETRMTASVQPSKTFFQVLDRKIT